MAIPLVLAAVVTAAAPAFIRIRPGDTLWALARSHHTTVAELQRLNGLSGDLIYAGQLLKVPGNGSVGPAPAAPAAGGGLWVTVRPGDTVWAIAARHGGSVAAVIAQNRLRADGLIFPGQRLLVRAGSTPVTGAATAGGTAGAAAGGGGGRPAAASVAQVIRRVAAQQGVEPALALAVAWQESGFQQHVVSPAGAVGVMQVMPGTGAWLARDVLHRPLNLANLEDNVLAGVALLRLLSRTVPVQTAVAAYYQGLGSVRAHGMYADTRRYVAAVFAHRARFA